MTLYINHDKRLILYGDEAAVGFMLEEMDLGSWIWDVPVDLDESGRGILLFHED